MRYRNLVVHPLVPRGEITLLEKQQEQHPWYRPTLAQLAWYADPLYYDETPESKVFQRYLRDRFSLTGTRSRYCLGVFSGYVRRGRGVDDLAEIFDLLEFPTISHDEMRNMRIYEKVGPSVVAISSSMPLAGGSHKVERGSGFILSDNGYLMTNAHVVEGADAITVSLSDESTIARELVEKFRNSCHIPRGIYNPS